MQEGSNSNFSYVTLLSSDTYLLGVIMLQWSLLRVDSKYPLLVLCSDCLSESSIKMLNKHRLHYSKLNKHWEGGDSFNQEDGYEHWSNTFDKLYIWTLTQFDKIVYLDSDMQVIRNVDYLFDYPHLSAVRADKWNEPGINHLNSGLMVIRPNLKEFIQMRSLWESRSMLWRRNIGDQDIIRASFPGWGTRRELTLPSGLNVFYSEVSHGIIMEENVSPVSVIHYIGAKKPWMLSPRALWRRSRHNFLGKYLLRYAFALWYTFPRALLNGICKFDK